MAQRISSNGHYRAMSRAGSLRARRAWGGRRRSLPPSLLPGVARQRRGVNRVVAVLAGLALVSFLVLAVTIVVGALSTAAAVAATYRQYEDLNGSLPNAALVTADTFQTTRILDRNGKLLQEIADQDYGWRTFVPYEKISPYLIDATVASEDASFWSHEGVEPFAILRGALIIAGGSGSSGGSTITQQLVRSIHTEAIGNDFSVTRKWREALAAIALERQFSKHDIITMYVNQIFYGNRSYGVEAAAQTYFHKSAADLTLSEAALLAGIPQQPTYFNPALYPENVVGRQKYVLDQMVKLGYITRAEANDAMAHWPKVYPARDGDGAVLDHPHFVEYVKQYLYEKYPDKDFLKGGFNIYTTIDTDLQNRAEEIVSQNIQQLKFYYARNAALTVVVPWSGEILAMVGSADFNDAAIEGQVNITTSPQQPGSAIKPIVYAAAFEQGWNPGTVVLDAPLKIETPGATDPATGEAVPYYEPQNYMRNFNGAVTVRTALANSLNIPAVKAVEFAGGAEAIVEMARRLGIKHELSQPPADYGLSIGLGSGDVWPLELTNAYATIANEGKYVPVTPILKITDSEGNVLFDLDRENTLANAPQVLRPEVAYQLISILTDNQARAMIFTTQNLFGQTQTTLGRPTAAKSGTTNDFRDIWTMGFTTDVAIGVWVGNTRNDPLAEIDGIQGAGPIWSQLMIDMHTNPEFQKLLLGPDGQPVPPQFPRPAGIVDGVVCEATGGRPVDDWSNRPELLDSGGSPAQRCDQLTPWQYKDLVRTLDQMKKSGGNFTGGAAD
ncbi:MAG: transglycosylase domain-containing protein, partial [Thermomicrobiales bacterium]|nr:transglycosylase domain-containing protein [Thermomicrobiales bacterium]